MISRREQLASHFGVEKDQVCAASTTDLYMVETSEAHISFTHRQDPRTGKDSWAWRVADEDGVTEGQTNGFLDDAIAQASEAL
jgi:hypothetical protein